MKSQKHDFMSVEHFFFRFGNSLQEGVYIMNVNEQYI